MTDDEFNEYRDIAPKFNEFNEKYKDHKSMENFARDKAITMVYCSNKLEDTLPKGVESGETIKILLNAEFNTEDTENIEPWNADGDGLASRCQLVQHWRAYYFLNSQETLTMDAIKKTHHILMNGAVSSKGDKISNGKLRKISVNNGADTYISHEDVPIRFKELIDWYTTKVEETDPVKVATELFHRFVVIHPFEDGNGRIGRLLVTYHLQHSGTPFPVIISSGKTKSRTHYRKAIQKADRVTINAQSELCTLINYSVFLGWRNFLRNIKYSD